MDGNNFQVPYTHGSENTQTDFDLTTADGIKKWQETLQLMYQTNQMQGGGGQNTFSHSMSTNLSDISYIEQNSMYMTTSRVDDYPTSMSSHGTSRITNYDAEMLTGSAAGSSNTYRYKKGGFTELMLEQIRNSQEDDQSDSNRQQLERMQGTLTQMIIGNDMNENRSLENLDGIFGPQTDWSISESRTSYEGEQMASMADEDRSENGQYHWQTDVFNNMEIDEVQHEDEDDQPTMGENDLRIIAAEPTNSDITSAVTDDNEHVNGSQELTEEEIEEFIKSEQVAASAGNNAPISSKYTPQLSMEFKTRDDAHHFFNFYAFLAGFQVAITHTTRTQSKKRNNEVVKVTMRCNRQGKEKEPKSLEQQEADLDKDVGNKPVRRRKTNVQQKSECPCVMMVKEEGGIWKIKTLDLEHNHELCPGQRDQLFSGHKYMTELEKGLIKTLNDNNIPTRKMVSILSYLRGGLTALPMKKKDISNYRTKLNREIKGSDMTKVLDYFRKKQTEDTSFFFRFDLDEENRVRNLFWTDCSCMKYYADYGECVSFDTTYMTNRYNLPFAPFVGITGHGQSCLFACAFLHDETVDTFKWVFQTFLEAMGGKHPQTIITDQDMAMKSAIEQVFINTKHRNCLFHIKTKCYNKNIKVFAANEGLYEEFEDVVNNCLTEEEFERLWKRMIEERNLQGNHYFNRMWEMRKRFIPVYYKNDFFPFIQTTSRSEATNARFKDNVGPTYSILSFLKEYNRIVDSINQAERLEDNYSNQKRPKEFIFGYRIEQQAQQLYNRNIFKKFQLQLKETSRLNYRETEDGKTFEVWQKSNQIHEVHRFRRYTVNTELTQGQEEFTCICAKFSKDGILCSHILKIVIEKEISTIPEKYFIERWRKKNMMVHVERREEETVETSPLLRFNILSRKSTILNSKGSKTEQAMEYLMAEFNKMEINLDRMLSAQQSGEAQNDQQGSNEGGETIPGGTRDTRTEIDEPETIQRKGRPPKAVRMKTHIEEIKKKMVAAEKKKKKKTNDTENAGSPVKPKRKKRKETTNGGMHPKATLQ